MRPILRLLRVPLVLGGVAGAAAQFFFDPHSGKRRRHVARDRTMAFFRRGSRELGQKARYAEGVAEGLTHKASTPIRQAERSEEFDDVTLARKVETEIFRGRDVAKGDVNVNAEHGVVYLRGQLEQPEQIRELVEATEKVDGVKRVENLLHLPNTPAPTKDETRGKATPASSR
jgi:gas vesicle protein